jgi:hypothetical protein
VDLTDRFKMALRARGFGIAEIGGLILFALLSSAALSFLPRSCRRDPTRLKLPAPLPIPNGQHAGYTTNFSIGEDPISEGGKWINGKTIGLDWSDVATIPGLAYGTESGKQRGDNAYDDSVALLAGPWRPDQTVEATVRSVKQDENVFEEVELRLRSSLSAHKATGYEVLFRCMAGAQAYASIVRWDGSLGRFTYLTQKEGPEYKLSDGDLVKATIVGTLITAYINNTPVLQASDGAYSNGSPGMGFWLKRRSGVSSWFRYRTTMNVDYGFTRFAAW